MPSFLGGLSVLPRSKKQKYLPWHTGICSIVDKVDETLLAGDHGRQSGPCGVAHWLGIDVVRKSRGCVDGLFIFNREQKKNKGYSNARSQVSNCSLMGNCFLIPEVCVSMYLELDWGQVASILPKDGDDLVGVGIHEGLYLGKDLGQWASIQERAYEETHEPQMIMQGREGQNTKRSQFSFMPLLFCADYESSHDLQEVWQSSMSLVAPEGGM